MNLQQTTLSIAEREAEFQTALTEYRQTGSKTAWDTMFYRVLDCCHSICAKMLVGVRLDPAVFEDRYTDAALYTMKRIKEGLNPGKLSSYCYLVCRGRIHGPKAQWEDTHITYVGDFFPEVEKDAMD